VRYTKSIAACSLLALALALVFMTGRATQAAAVKPRPLPSAVPSPEPPPIESLLKPSQFSRIMEDREVITYADLKDESGEWKHYQYHAAMLVKGSLRATHETLTDYALYSRIIPYIDKTEFDPRTRLLHVEGGIWKFRLASVARFEERSPRWVHYEIVGGHFKGLQGDLFFESRGEKGTLVYIGGAARGTQWPPAFVVERGAEIVFAFTGRRMRSWVEDDSHKGSKDESQVPQPRSHLD
jgi:hypothetical protein